MAGWFARVDKAPDGKALFPGRAPTSLRAELERHAYYGAFGVEPRRPARSSYVQDGVSPTLDVLSPGALSLSIRSFFEVRTSLATLRRAHGRLTLSRACTRLSEVWERWTGEKGENAKERRAEAGWLAHEKSRVFSERGDKGEQREGGLRSAGEGQLRRE